MSEHPELVLLDVRITRPITYCFYFEGYSAWAHVTINAVTGELSIQSDWGNFAHRWSVSSLEPSDLTQFIIQCEPDYIVRKLAKDGAHGLKEVVDEDATWEHLREYICTERRARNITKEKAREYWVFAKEWTEDRHWDAVDVATCLDELDMYEHIQHKNSHTYESLVQRLIPCIQEWLRNNGLEGVPE